MKILVFSLCFNEEKILPFYIDYYLNFIKADKIVIYDGGSTDNTSNIVKNNPKIEFIVDDKGNMDERNLTDLRNNGWKKYKNDYNWIIVCDMDEFIYHPNIKKLLKFYDDNKITIADISGYDMISNNFPEFKRGKYLPSFIKKGIPEPTWLNKKAVFKPNDVEINYDFGTHSCNPTGNVKFSENKDIKLLQYKWLSYDYIVEKSLISSKRLSDWNLQTGMASHYKEISKISIDDFNKKEKMSMEIVKDFPKSVTLFWHCYLINNWEIIFEEQLDLIKKSELYNNVNEIHLYYHGDYLETNKLIRKVCKNDIDEKIILNQINENFYEYPTLQKLYEFSLKNDCYIGYIHLKGVWSSLDNTRNPEAVRSWRKCLEYFNIEKWKDCVDKLKNGYDVVGALYNYNEKEPLFSGNFWWATSDYVKKLQYPDYEPLKNPYLNTPEDDGTWCRVECEKWINTIPNKFYNFYTPKDYGFYYVPINNGDYRKDIKYEHFYENIDGWFDFQEIYTEMVNKYKDGSHFVEIGAWLGKSTSYMAVEIANSGKKIKFDVIDIWDQNYKIFDDNITYLDFLNNINHVKEYINPLIGNSIDISKNYKSESIDFIFIDADHSYESIKNDIKHWYSKLKIGGTMAGHDYNINTPGVIKAVNEFFGEKNIKIKGTSWVYKKNNYKISIIIPTYNRNNVLKECIDSVLNQNYENIEILVCHDGPSNEKYNEVKLNYIDDNRIKFHDTEKRSNSLGSTQRNLMLEKITGDYILFLDDDNILYPNYFKKMIEQIDDNTGMVVCKIHFNDKDWSNLTLPIKKELIPSEIDHLSILFNAEIANQIIWDDYWGQDHRFINACENIINIKNMQIKYIDDILANHRYLGEKDKKIYGIKEIIKESNRFGPQQNVWEYEKLLKRIVKKKKTGNILEIGTKYGGTTYGFCKIFDSVISIDIFKEPQIDELEKEFNNLIFILGNSHNQSTRDKLKNLKFDVIFIDGDHDYKSVKQDYIDYKKFLKYDGFIIFHDIKRTSFTDESGIQVPILWEEIKNEYSYEEIINDSDNCFGIGILQNKKLIDDEIYIITSHPSYKMSEDITIKTLKKLKSFNEKIILSSHCPVSNEIQELCDFFIYDKNNPLIKHDFFTQSWFNTDDYYALLNITKNDNNLNHALGVYLNYYNSLILAKQQGFKIAVCTNFDMVFSDDDKKIIDDKIKDMKINNKKAFFMNTPEKEGVHYKTIFFITDIDYFLNTFKYILDENKYKKELINVGSNTNCLENFFYHKLKDKTNELLLQEINENELFPTSEINLFSLIEYYTILPVEGCDKCFIVWFSSANSLDSRIFNIKIVKNENTILNDIETIGKQYVYYKKLKFEKNDIFEINFIIKDGDEILKNKTIIVNNDIFEDIKSYGNFIDKKNIEFLWSP